MYQLFWFEEWNRWNKSCHLKDLKCNLFERFKENPFFRPRTWWGGCDFNRANAKWACIWLLGARLSRSLYCHTEGGTSTSSQPQLSHRRWHRICHEQENTWAHEFILHCVLEIMTCKVVVYFTQTIQTAKCMHILHYPCWAPTLHMAQSNVLEHTLTACNI
jgi:hypothetical protein